MDIIFPYNFKGVSLLGIDDGEVVLNISPVTEYTKMPDIQIPENFTVASPEEWFDNLHDVRLYVLNGVSISDYPSDGDCDYCHRALEGSEYSHCKDCDKSMCEQCFTEMTNPCDADEVIAMGIRGAKNYKKRKSVLAVCFAHLDSFVRCPIISKCVLCNVTSYIKTGVWYRGIDRNNNNIEVCADCLCVQSESTGITDERECCMCDVKDTQFSIVGNGFVICKACVNTFERLVYCPSKKTYGSMLEWIPVLQDGESNMLFINLARDSAHYLKVSLGTFDDHYRMGIYTVDSSYQDVLQELTLIQKAYNEKYDHTESSWKKHYASPICKYLRKRGFQVHFG